MAAGRAGRRASFGRAARYTAGVLIAAFLLPAGVIPTKDKLTDDEKVEILRGLSSEYAKAKTYFPRSKKPLPFDAKDGTWDQKSWQMMAQQNGGPAAREGDQVQITHVGFEGDKLLIQVNGGLKTGDKWYDHIQVGVGGMGRQVGNGGPPSLGTSIEVDFHKPLENLNSDQLKKILSPLLEFDKRTVTKVYSETLPPEVQKAINEKRALAGMSRDEVLMAMGHPVRKIRETKDGVDLEDWIFGEAPGKITFVTFSGSKVVKVKEQYAGLGIQSAAPQITP